VFISLLRGPVYLEIVVCCISRDISIENAKTGNELLLQFCWGIESYFGKDCTTPNMHSHCHVIECIEDYGPVQGFQWAAGIHSKQQSSN